MCKCGLCVYGTSGAVLGVANKEAGGIKGVLAVDEVCTGCNSDMAGVVGMWSEADADGATSTTDFSSTPGQYLIIYTNERKFW